MIATNIIDEDAETEKNGTSPSLHGKRQNLIFKLGLLEKKSLLTIHCKLYSKWEYCALWLYKYHQGEHFNGGNQQRKLSKLAWLCII